MSAAREQAYTHMYAECEDLKKQLVTGDPVLSGPHGYNVRLQQERNAAEEKGLTFVEYKTMYPSEQDIKNDATWFLIESCYSRNPVLGLVQARGF